MSFCISYASVDNDVTLIMYCSYDRLVFSLKWWLFLIRKVFLAVSGLDRQLSRRSVIIDSLILLYGNKSV